MSKEIEKSTGTRELSCTLTDAERLKAGNDLVEFLNQINKKESELKSISARYKVEINDLQVKADYQAELIKSGFEMRETAIETVKDFKAGTVKITRTDTKEVIESRKMMPEEGQRVIPLDDKSALLVGAAAPVYKKLFSEESKNPEPKPKAVKPKVEAKVQEHVQTAPQAPIEPPPAPITDFDVEAATEAIKTAHRASVSTLQRRLRMSANAAQRLMDELEKRGIVGPAPSDGGCRGILK